MKCKVECKGVQTGVKVQTSARINPRDYVALPAEKDEPASAAAGRRRRCCGAGGKYLCYDCLKKSKAAGKVRAPPRSS